MFKLLQWSHIYDLIRTPVKFNQWRLMFKMVNCEQLAWVHQQWQYVTHGWKWNHCLCRLLFNLQLIAVRSSRSPASSGYFRQIRHVHVLNGCQNWIGLHGSINIKISLIDINRFFALLVSVRSLEPYISIELIYSIILIEDQCW